MFRIHKLIPARFAVAVTIFVGSWTNAETPDARTLKPTPTPTPSSQKRYPITPLDPLRTPRPQNQSIVNTSKRNVKALGTPTPTPTAKPKDQAKGWDGKVQGNLLHRAPSPTPTPTPPKSR
jgi:hypothetical protein